MWRSVYNFPTEGEGNASHTDKFCNGKFTSPVHVKDRYVVNDCKNPRYQRVSEFLVPILSPDRQVGSLLLYVTLCLGLYREIGRWTGQ